MYFLVECAICVFFTLLIVLITENFRLRNTPTIFHFIYLQCTALQNNTSNIFYPHWTTYHLINTSRTISKCSVLYTIMGTANSKVSRSDANIRFPRGAPCLPAKFPPFERSFLSAVQPCPPEVQYTNKRMQKI